MLLLILRLPILLSLCTRIANSQSCNVTSKDDQKISACQFPFIFGGNIYYGCTTVDDPEDKLWCSISTNDTHHHIAGKSSWGYCTSNACPKDADFNSNNVLALEIDNELESLEKLKGSGRPIPNFNHNTFYWVK